MRTAIDIPTWVDMDPSTKALITEELTELGYDLNDLAGITLDNGRVVEVLRVLPAPRFLVAAGIGRVEQLVKVG